MIQDDFIIANFLLHKHQDDIIIAKGLLYKHHLFIILHNLCIILCIFFYYILILIWDSIAFNYLYLDFNTKNLWQSKPIKEINHYRTILETNPNSNIPFWGIPQLHNLNLWNDAGHADIFPIMPDAHKPLVLITN